MPDILHDVARHSSDAARWAKVSPKIDHDCCYAATYPCPKAPANVPHEGCKASSQLWAGAVLTPGFQQKQSLHLLASKSLWQCRIALGIVLADLTQAQAAGQDGGKSRSVHLVGRQVFGMQDTKRLRTCNTNRRVPSAAGSQYRQPCLVGSGFFLIKSSCTTKCLAVA